MRFNALSSELQESEQSMMLGADRSVVAAAQGAEVALVISQCTVIKGIKGISMCVKICWLEAVFY